MRKPPSPAPVVVAMAGHPSESFVCVALEQAGYQPLAVTTREEASLVLAADPVDPVAVVAADPAEHAYAVEDDPAMAFVNLVPVVVVRPTNLRYAAEGMRPFPDLGKMLASVARLAALRQPPS